jgi:hypothetical protein
MARFWLCVLALAGLGVGGLHAQDESVPTLHAYTDLVQIPVLVLGSDRKPIPPIAETRFFVSLDGGPRFRVHHARLEGDDQISLAVLLDLSEPDRNMMDQVDDALADLVPRSLHEKDHVSVYALDCHLTRSATDLPADSATLKSAVDVALQPWRTRGRIPPKGGCKNHWYLWDSVAAVTDAMRQQVGRRVILVITNGVDEGSKNSWNELRLFAQSSGVAIFGLTNGAYPAVSFNFRPQPYQTAINAVCELSGGMVLTADGRNLEREMERFVELVRGRYIVEFPHPVSTTGGYHDMIITIEKSNAFIRAAGIGLPLDDPAVLNDPSRVPSDPGRAPQLGKGHVTVPK